MDDLDDIAARIDRLMPQAQVLAFPKAAPAVKQEAKPAGWRFVPHRDENNLIVEIIATPIE